ncbi:hypothetical protein L7F22_018908 [Adiantum nelumboides]|nr:hypothetical protein [Adiantum nelumboides]
MIDLNQPAEDVVELDLNKPIEHTEEALIAPMVGTTYDSKEDETHLLMVKQKKVRDKAKAKQHNQTYRAKILRNPKDYELFKARHRQLENEKNANLTTAEREQKNLKRRLRYKERMDIQKAQDPNFRTRDKDKRSELRKRVREGKATKEDLVKYAELKKKDSIRFKNRYNMTKPSAEPNS